MNEDSNKTIVFLGETRAHLNLVCIADKGNP